MFLSKDINKFLHKIMNVRIQRTNLKYLIEALNEVYPNKWDLSVDNNYNVVDTLLFSSDCKENEEEELENFFTYFYKNNYRLYYSITIHYPEIIITDGKNKHKIIDLYVRLNIEDSYKYGISIFNIMGTRASKTVNEISSAYCHSHLVGRRLPDGYFTGFCLGTGPLNQELSKSRSYNNKNDYIYFLLLLDNYVKWESREGIPYRYISSIGSSEIKNNFSSRDIEFVLSNYKFRNLNFKITDSNIEILSDSNIEEQLTTYLKDKGFTFLMCYKTPEGKYVSNERKQLINDYKQYEGRELFTFKGETIKFRIVNNENLNDYEYNAANPNFTKQICDKLSSKLTKKHILTSSGVIKKNIVKDTQESNAPDKISV